MIALEHLTIDPTWDTLRDCLDGWIEKTGTKLTPAEYWELVFASRSTSIYFDIEAWNDVEKILNALVKAGTFNNR